MNEYLNEVKHTLFINYVDNSCSPQTLSKLKQQKNKMNMLSKYENPDCFIAKSECVLKNMYICVQ